MFIKPRDTAITNITLVSNTQLTSMATVLSADLGCFSCLNGTKGLSQF